MPAPPVVKREHEALGAETQRLKIGEQWCALSGGAGIPGSLEIGFCPEKTQNF